MSSDSKERSVFLRVLFAIIWLPTLVIFGVTVVGIVVGQLAPGDPAGYQEAYDLAYQASFNFMQEYRAFVFLGIFIVWLLLSIFGKLPGTSK